MSSLQILKQILPLDEDEIPKEIVSPLQELDLSNLKQYIQHSQQPGNSLEQIRSDSDPSFLADDEQLSFLISSFEEYKLEIRSHRSKLKPIQSIISNFNTDLSSLSSSLIVSREKSAKLSQNLKAQKTLTEKLNPIIIDLIVPPEIIKSVIKSPVNESWLENLSFINEKLQLIEQINESKDGSGAGSVYFGSVAFNELEKSIHSITSKAVERIRDYIISKIKLLRSNSSQTSSQLIQRELLSVKEIFLFLMQHHPELGKQLRLAYTYTMKWYYETRFAKYIYALEKLKLRHVDQSLLLGSTTSAEVTSTFGGLGFGWFSLSELLQLQLQQQQQNQLPSVPGSAASHKIIMSEYLPSIDKRIQLLHPIVEEEESPEEAIPSQIAETSPFAYWLEFVYKQWSVALMDNTIVEYLFMVEFFYLGDEKFDEIDEQSIMNDKNSNAAAANGTKLKNWSQIMFTNVFKMGYEFVQWLITHQPLAFLPKNSNANSRIISSATIAANVASTGSSSTFGTCDGYAILLMIRMIQISQSSLHNEFHIPIADEYLNSLYFCFGHISQRLLI